MKKNKFFSLFSATVVAASLGLTSCELDLAPIDYYGANSFWTTEAQAIGDIHAMMQHFRTFDFQTNITYGEIRGGAYTLETTGSDGSNLAAAYLREQNLSVTNYGVANFGNYWGLIANVNLFIARVEPADYFSSEETKNYCLGMAYGMRAYYYFILYRAYGGVPLRLIPDVADGNYDPVTLYMKRAQPSEVMAQIKKDITTSLNYFGNQTTFNFDNESGNAKYYWSKAATEMLAGEVYLWNSKVTIGDQAADKNDLATAKTHFQNVINNYGLGLQGDFSAVFDPENKQNSEIIMAFKYDENEASNGFSGYCYSATTGLTLGNAFDINGETWADPLRIGGNVHYYQYSNALWYQYDEADTRRDATFISSWHDKEATQLRGTFVRKHIGSISALTSYRTYDSDHAIYRLPLAYLSLAEIANMEGDNTGVKNNINKIRERAYGDAWSEDVYGYTPGSFAENEVAILHEKDKEFVQEGQRWWDVCRMSVSSACGTTDHLVFHNEGHVAYGLAVNDLREATSKSWAEANSITVQPLLSTENAYRVLWPIDTSTLSSDTELEQTPGY